MPLMPLTMDTTVVPETPNACPLGVGSRLPAYSKYMLEFRAKMAIESALRVGGGVSLTLVLYNASVLAPCMSELKEFHYEDAWKNAHAASLALSRVACCMLMGLPVEYHAACNGVFAQTGTTLQEKLFGLSLFIAGDPCPPTDVTPLWYAVGDAIEALDQL